MPLPPPQQSEIHDLITTAERDHGADLAKVPILRRPGAWIRANFADIVWPRLLLFLGLAVLVAAGLLFVRPLLEMLPGQSQALPDQSPNSGSSIARGVRNFIFPLVVVLIGVVSLRYLGKNKTAAEFFVFFVCAAAICVVIVYGDRIFASLGSLFIGFVEGDPPGGVQTKTSVELFRAEDFVVAGIGALAIVIAGIRVVPGYGARRRGSEISDEIRQAVGEGASADEIEQRLAQRFGTAETMRRRIDRFIAEESTMAAAAQQAILPLLPKNPRMAKRLVSQLRLTLVIAYGRGLLDGTSPVTAGHVAKWVVFADRWPALVDQLTKHPA